jgi:hypothetical protein
MPNFPISSIWKFIRKPLLVLLGSFFAIVLSCLIIASVYEKEITNYFIQKINEQLNTKVAIGKVEFSLLNNFPDATVRLTNVAAEHSKPFNSAGKLMQLEQIDFRFGMLDFFNGDYSIQRIDLKNGSINILKNKKGIINYQLIKEDSSQTKSQFSFSLNKLTLSNVNMLIRDDVANLSIGFLANKASAKGDFTETIYDIEVQADCQANSIKSNKITLLENRPVALDVALKIDQQKEIYTFIKGDFAISDLECAITGNISDHENTFVDLLIKGKDMEISTVLSLLPPGYDEQIEQFKSSGNIYLTAQLKGEWTSEITPQIRVDFGISNADIKQKKTNIELKNVSCIGMYSNGIKAVAASSSLELKNIKMNLNGGNVAGNFSIQNFNSPYVSFASKANIQLSDVQEFLQIKSVESLQGKAAIDLSMEGNWSSFSSENLKSYNQIKSKGYIQISNCNLKISGDSLTYSNIQGNLQFNNNEIIVENFRANAGKTDLIVKGKIINAFNWMFDANESIEINASLQSKLVILDELFQRKSVTANANTYKFGISPRINLNLNTRINEIKFRKFAARNIVGDFAVNNKQLIATRLQLSTMSGNVVLSGKVDASETNKLKLLANINLNKVDIRELFYQCENFGQNVLEDKNIKGKVTSKIMLLASSDAAMDIDINSINSTADIEINQGELIQFEPLRELSKFISLDELKNVTFSQLKNQIEIKNRTIIIPQMDITSSAITISASGTHTFENVIDYHLKLLLSDVLSRKAKKAKKENEEFGIIADDGLGKTNIFISMKGPINNPKIGYDGKGAQQKIKNDLVQEKQSLKKILNQEFGLFKRDSAVVNSKPDKDKKKQQKVIIEFDE